MSAKRSAWRHRLSLACATVLLLTSTNYHVRASGLNNAPFIVRGNHGITTLNNASMVLGRPVERASYLKDAVKTSAPKVKVNVRSAEMPVVKDDLIPSSSLGVSKNVSDLVYLASYFNVTFEMNADVINTKWKSAEAKQMPWPGSYYPSYYDGLNYPLGDTVSAMEKYALATGQDPKLFMDKVSADSGVDAYNYYPGCSTDSQCPSTSKCAIRAGRSWGYCIPIWIGSCHAWAPASMQEPEPKCPVFNNGQIFYVQDIKALLTLGYTDANITVLFAGVRFDGGDNDQKDQYGRFVDNAHRDINPAVFHVALANILGRLGKVFLIDTDASAAIWNNPVRSYSFSEPKSMTPDDAARQFFNTPSYKPFNPNAKSVYYMKNEFKYIEEGYENGPLSIPGVVDKYTQTRHYEYLLELDDNKNIIGGEWVGNSRYDHPDFLWFPLRRPADGVITRTGLRWDFANMLNQIAQKC